MNKFKIFIQEILNELEKAENEHFPMNSFHEGYSVILEELEEMWIEIKKKNQDKTKIKKELTQLAAMCIRFYKDLLK